MRVTTAWAYLVPRIEALTVRCYLSMQEAELFRGYSGGQKLTHGLKSVDKLAHVHQRQRVALSRTKESTTKSTRTSTMLVFQKEQYSEWKEAPWACD